MLTVNEVLTRGVAEILPSKKGLEDLMNSKKITLYQGFDPSMSSLHLGNYAGVLKLSQFQRLGHRVIFLVGDFTGMIGDPTDKLATRRMLTRDEVIKNASNWQKQIKNVLDFEGKNKAEIRYNSEWLDKISFKDLIGITSNFTVQQLVERDMFQKRLKDGKPIHLHEFLYPVAQGYDSVFMNVDLEIGGSDQTFNMLAGRNLMQKTKSKDKFVLSTKLLVDKEGNKVGKTTGNALFLDSQPEDFFAGIMSFPDSVIELGFELLTETSLDCIGEKIKLNPMNEKKRLSFEVVKIIWGENEAKNAQDKFEKTFQEKKPDYEKTINLQTNLISTLASVLGSKSKAKRLIQEGAVDINGKTIDELNFKIKNGDLIKVGSRQFFRVK